MHLFNRIFNGLALILFACLLPTGQLFATTSDDTHNIAGHGGPINSIAISPDGKTLLSGSLDYAVMLWNLEAKPVNLQSRFIAHEGAVSAVTYFPESTKALSAGDDGHLYLWDLSSAKMQKSPTAHKGKTVAISISNDETIAATASWDGTLRLWDLKTLDTLLEIKVHKETVNAVLISPDKKHIYSGSYDGKIRAWDAASGELKNILYENGWPVTTMRWLSNQTQIAFGSTNGEVQIYDLPKQRRIRALESHDNKPVLGMAVSDPHQLLATGGNDGVIRVWRTDNWHVIGELKNIRGPAWALDFTGDGKSIYYGSLDDEIQFWQISPNNKKQVVNKDTRRFQVTKGISPGQVQFARKCSVCHTLKPGDANRAGPSLHQVFGRKAGTLPGYPYSESLITSDLIWNEETIDRLFADGPHKVVPGTKMPLQKMPSDENRKALIEYLKQATR